MSSEDSKVIQEPWEHAWELKWICAPEKQEADLTFGIENQKSNQLLINYLF